MENQSSGSFSMKPFQGKGYRLASAVTIFFGLTSMLNGCSSGPQKEPQPEDVAADMGTPTSCPAMKWIPHPVVAEEGQAAQVKGPISGAPRPEFDSCNGTCLYSSGCANTPGYTGIGGYCICTAACVACTAALPLIGLACVASGVCETFAVTGGALVTWWAALTAAEQAAVIAFFAGGATALYAALNPCSECFCGCNIT